MSSIEHKTWHLLAQAISGTEVDFTGFEGDFILKKATQHGVIPLLDQQIHAGMIHGLAEYVKQAIRESTKSQVAFDVLQRKTTEETLSKLADGGVETLLLKGVPVAHLFYSNAYTRSRVDVDLYIRDSDRQLCSGILSQGGFKITGLTNRKYTSKQFGATISPFHNANIHFDVHWKLSNRELFKDTLPFEECLEASQPIPSLGKNAHALSSIDLLLHACIHRISHARNTERDRLIWLYDIFLLANSTSSEELEQFKEKALGKSVGNLCADALEVTSELFGGQLPIDYCRQLRKNQHHEPTARLVHASKLRWTWADLAAQQGLGDRMRFAGELLANKLGR